MRIKLEIEIEYDADLMHASDIESVEWFKNEVLTSPVEGDELELHSNAIGESIGTIISTKILAWPADDSYSISACPRCGKFMEHGHDCSPIPSSSCCGCGERCEVLGEAGLERTL